MERFGKVLAVWDGEVDGCLGDGAAGRATAHPSVETAEGQNAHGRPFRPFGEMSSEGWGRGKQMKVR